MTLWKAKTAAAFSTKEALVVAQEQDRQTDGDTGTGTGTGQTDRQTDSDTTDRQKDTMELIQRETQRCE